MTIKSGTKIIRDKDVSKQLYYELTPQRIAILDLIAYTEGTDRDIGNTKAGYDILFTGRKFTGFAKHPNKVICQARLCSSAAGRYQILTDTWNWIQKRLTKNNLHPFPTFEPQYQDQAALYLIDAKRQSMNYVDDRDFNEFLDFCSWEWASLCDPDTGKGRYGQPIVSLKQSTKVYNQLFDLWNN